MRVLGVDPGLSGALAIIERIGSEWPRLLDATMIRTTGEGAKKRVDVAATIAWIRKHDCDVAFIERAQAMPDQGASSGFSYGRAVGALEACIEGLLIPHRVIESTAWKKAHGLTHTTKEDSRQRALKLFPAERRFFERKMDHNVAEAALIAWFGATVLSALGETKKRDDNGAEQIERRYGAATRAS